MLEIDSLNQSTSRKGTPEVRKLIRSTLGSEPRKRASEPIFGDATNSEECSGRREFYQKKDYPESF